MSTAETNIVSNGEANLPANPDIAAHYRTRLSSSEEKKRVQNRLAQRAYRRRLKAKLAELEERVKVQEQHVEESTRGQSCSSALASTTASGIVDSTCPAPAAPHGSAINVSFFMTPSSDINGSGVAFGAEVVDQVAFPDSNDLTTTFSPGSPVPGASRSAAGVPAGFGNPHTFCSPKDLHNSSPDNEAQGHLTHYTADVPQKKVQRNMDATAPVQDRIRYIIDQAAAVGFDTLDEVVAAYYAEMFEDTSPLGQDQRLNRNRRLPQLLSTLHQAAKAWSKWERRKFQEQITLGAEEILVEELKSFVAQHPTGSADQERAYNHPGGEQFERRRDPRERHKIQDDLPHLWALTAALLAKTNALKQNASADAVLAVIEILCFGRIENSRG